MNPPPNPPYPLQIDVAYPDQLNRLSTFFRGILLFPGYVVGFFLALAAFVVIVCAWFAILFTGKYPEGLFNFMAGYMRFSARFAGYSWLVTDKFQPLTTAEDPNYPIQMRITPPAQIARWRCFIQPIMTFPALIAAFFVGFLAYICVFLGWFAILFTGRYPAGLFNTAVIGIRWQMRVNMYYYLMTEEYPPFVFA